jgi:serine/threonine protein kinase
VRDEIPGRDSSLDGLGRNKCSTVALSFESADTPIARVLGGRWELLSPLARGGMGVLYVGQHLQTGRRAAIKVIEQASPEALARFRLEASVCAQITHPGVVDVFDADLDPETGSCFIAMELLEGCTLREVMDDPKSTPGQVMELLINALEPLGAAHAKGFVHRDLKPENLFVLAAARGSTKVKLLDFGIVAQKSDQRLTRAGMAMGTPHYMSPEQCTSARDAGPASDVWSIGIMLYEAIKGDVPFAGETSHGVIVQACTCPHMPLDHVVPGVDPAIARLIDRCLEKQPAARPEHAQALLDELRHALKPNSLPVARPSLRSRASRSPETTHSDNTSVNTHVRPSLRTRSVANAANVLAASGVICSLSALALPFVGLAAPGTALLCAAVGGGLLLTASSRIKALRELVQVKNDNAMRPAAPVPATVVLSERPKPLLHPLRGRPEASVRIELYADLTCAITRRVCQRVLSLRVEHPDDISIVYKPYWDPQREHAAIAAEIARALFEREGPEVFWAFFDRMLLNTRRVTTDLLFEHASQVCPDMHGLRRALRTHLHRRPLQLCRDEAESNGIDQSPTLRINGTVLSGETSEDRLRWAFVDAKSGVDQRRKVELGETKIDEIPLSKLTAVRGLLVRYRGARNAPVGLARTREEARERARKLRSRAGMEGADFADVALRFADALLEPETLAPRMGDPGVGEVVLHLRVGDMSEPIECDEGFQVLQRLA